MRIRHTRQRDPDLNITPLIDVVFLLLIFFMVSTTFKQESEITIQLPEANAKEMETKEQVVEVAIDAEGRYYVNEQEVVNTRLETLKKAIQKVSDGSAEEPSLIISADAKTPHQAVITAMDAARQLGILHLTFATQKPLE